MKKMLALLLALTLSLGVILAEAEADFLGDLDVDAEADDFAYGFDDEDSYEGEWVQISALNAQLCLPDGWTEQPAGEGAVFTAEKDDQTVRLEISLLAEGVEDIETWAQAQFADGTAYELTEAGLYAAVVREDEANHALFIDLCTDGAKLVRFSFVHAAEDALTRNFALSIAGTLYEDIFDDSNFLAGDDEPLEDAGQEETPSD